MCIASALLFFRTVGMTIESRLAVARGHIEEGRVNDAIRTCTEILGDAPHQPDALHMLGAVALRLGQAAQALAFADALVLQEPDKARGWMLRASTLRVLQRAQETLVAAQKALACDPNIADAWECAAASLMQLGCWREARRYLEQALDRFPDHANLQAYYALALAEEGETAEAWQATQRALALDPQNAAALIAKTTILSNAGYYDLVRAVCLDAADHGAIGKTMKYAAATAALVTGQYAEGYAEMTAARIAHGPALSLPEWQGEENPALRVVLFGEQGFGDTLQLIRFADRVAQKTVGVIARVPMQLERLIRHSMPHLNLSVYKPPMTQERQVLNEPDPVFDFPPEANARCSFLNLPHALRLNDATDVARVPYLHTPPELIETWRSRLAHMPSPRIGLVWQGSPQHGNDHNRSIAFDTLAPLIEKFGSHLVSLQLGPESTRARKVGLFDAAPFISDFADSAAALSEVDVLITVDTSMAHLAGALGKPVWLMLPFNPDWRWLLGREDSVWYPSARLFRKSQPKNWSSVIEKIAEDIARLIDGDRTVLTPKPWLGEPLRRHPEALPLPRVVDNYPPG
jgi:tetratricopeptide (TPR) repeat protein